MMTSSKCKICCERCREGLPARSGCSARSRLRYVTPVRQPRAGQMICGPALLGLGVHKIRKGRRKKKKKKKRRTTKQKQKQNRYHNIEKDDHSKQME